MTVINIDALRFDNVFCTSNGSNICRLCDGDGELVLMPESLRSPFNAGTSDKDPLAKRLNLQLVVDDDHSLLEALQNLDKWAVAYLTEHSERIFKRNWRASSARLRVSDAPAEE